MLFNSWEFAILLIVTFVCYYTPLLRRFQVWTLVVASSVFYAWTAPCLLLLLYCVVLVNALSSFGIAFTDNLKIQKIYAITGITLDIAVLAFFKYSPLIGSSFFDTAGGVGEFLVKIPLPIGISFYTFQGISLVADVFNRKYMNPHEVISRSFFRHFQRTLFFISFFPQLIAGPIVKAHEFMFQIAPKRFADIQWESVFRFLVLGYFFKMVVADNLKDWTVGIDFPMYQFYGTRELILLVFGYAIQMFADFQGYSLIAIGLSLLFGYKLRINFNYPFLATSFKDFWSRWHISLSTFLFEYLYIPLGGNRKGKFRTYINLILTMSIGGLWHGTQWGYLMWGFAHGLLLAMERPFIKKKHGGILFPGYGIVVFVGFAVLLLLFRLQSAEYFLGFWNALFSNTRIGAQANFGLCVFMLPVAFYYLRHVKRQKWAIFASKYDYIYYGMMLFFIVVNSGSPGSFVYFQF